MAALCFARVLRRKSGAYCWASTTRDAYATRAALALDSVGGRSATFAAIVAVNDGAVIMVRMALRLELFHFHYRDPRTGKWVRARYRADRDEIAARYAEWEVIGTAEVRDIDPGARYFTLHNSPLDAALRGYDKRPPELGPAIDAAEAFLVAVFLRRYVTYCARRRRYGAMNGAAGLHAK